MEAALANPSRVLLRLVATSERARALSEALAARGEDAGVRLEVLEGGEVARLLPPGAVHQGVALRAEPLEELGIDDVADPAHGVIPVSYTHLTLPTNREV